MIGLRGLAGTAHVTRARPLMQLYTGSTLPQLLSAANNPTRLQFAGILLERTANEVRLTADDGKGLSVNTDKITEPGNKPITAQQRDKILDDTFDAMKKKIQSEAQDIL